MTRLWPAIAFVAAVACGDENRPAAEDAPCGGCGPGELCVVRYDGLCESLGPGRCVPTSCTGCTAECERELCVGDAGPGFRCMVTPCTTLPPGEFACYGS